MSAITLRLTHTNLTDAQLYLTDIFAATDGPYFQINKAGALYINPGATVDLTFTTDVALSYGEGVIRTLLDGGFLTASFVVDPAFSDGVAGWEGIQNYFVGKHGSDSNNGKSFRTAFLTFNKAITAATSDSPSSSNRISILCTDGGSYTEDLSIPSWIEINASGAHLNGTVIIQDNAGVSFGYQTVSDDIAILKFIGTGYSWATIRNQHLSGTAVGLLNTSDGTLFFRSDRIDVDDGYGVGGSSSEKGDTQIDIGSVVIRGTGVGISRYGAGITSGQVNKIVDLSGGTALNTQNGGGLDLQVGVIDCNTAYEVDAGTTLRLFVTNLTGTEIDNGTTFITEAGLVFPGKSGIVLNADFSLVGGLYSANVVFTTPSSTSNYAVSLSPEVSSNGLTFSPSVSSKLNSGFTIQLNTANKTGLVGVNWQMMPYMDP